MFTIHLWTCEYPHRREKPADVNRTLQLCTYAHMQTGFLGGKQDKGAPWVHHCYTQSWTQAALAPIHQGAFKWVFPLQETKKQKQHYQGQCQSALRLFSDHSPGICIDNLHISYTYLLMTPCNELDPFSDATGYVHPYLVSYIQEDVDQDFTFWK